MVISPNLYTSGGTKLRQQTKIGSDITEMTDYSNRTPEHREGSTDSSLAFFLMPEGRIICHSEQSEELMNL